jgi:hypothetical protein
LPIYSLLTCRDLSRQPVAFIVARFLVVQCSSHSHSPWSIVSYPTQARGRPEQHLSFANGPFVYRGSHPCFDRNPRYYRIAIRAHLAVIPSFLPLCQQSSPFAIVNLRRVHSGQSSLVLIQSSRDRYPHEMGSTSGLYHIQVPPDISETYWFETACHSFERIFRSISVS